MKTKNILSLLTLIFCFNIAFSSNQWVNIKSNNPIKAEKYLVSDKSDKIVVKFEIPGFTTSTVNTPKGEAVVINLKGSSANLNKGCPDIPNLTASVIIPDANNMNIDVVSSKYIDYPMMDIAPSKGNLTRNIDPNNVPYEYGRVYSEDKFYPSELATLSSPFIVRDYRGQTIIVNPFQYNPVSKVLRVYYELEVQVVSAGKSIENILTSRPEKLNSDFNSIYKTLFLNAPEKGRFTQIEERGKILILCHDAFMEAMQPFVKWKKSIGFPTEIVAMSTVGNNSTSIKNYVKTYYETNGLTYLLLVGDNPQITPILNGTGLGGPSDVAYSFISGNDHYPEFYIGRFSAENIEHVTTQVERTIKYEKNPETTTDWFSKGMGIASDEGPGDDGEYDYQHIRNIKTKLLAFTYTQVAELYAGSQGGDDASGTPTPTQIATVVNNGITIGNYTGHGGPTSWVTSGFDNSNISSLVNNNKWPYLFSVACVNGEFVNQLCFAEAWLRAKNNNGPTGAIGAFMSTINQGWKPPMEGQDVMNDILTENVPNNIKRTIGGLSFSGSMGMLDKYPGEGKKEIDTWTFFGDPSTMLRTAMPTQITAECADDILIGTNTYTINCADNGAYACLSLNDEILGGGVIANGTTVITLPALTVPENAKLMITHFNKIPFEKTVGIIPANGPYVTFGRCVLNDNEGNNNGVLDYNEAAKLSLTLKNVGIEAISNVNVKITTDSQYITITDDSETYPSIGIGDTAQILNGFAIKAKQYVPNNQKIKINFIATSGSHSFNGSFSLVANSVSLKVMDIEIDDNTIGNNNNGIDPGETLMLKVLVKNIGKSMAKDVKITLKSNNTNLIVETADNSIITEINPNNTKTLSFKVKANAATPSGDLVTLTAIANAFGNYSDTLIKNEYIGKIDVLVIDIDKNHNSGTKMKEVLDQLNVNNEYKTAFVPNLYLYKNIFVCLGVYNQNIALTTQEGENLAQFLMNGGNIYMEGGDCWKYDAETAVRPMFKINGLEDGSSTGDLTTIIGQQNTIAQGLSFQYNGDNKFIDRLGALDTAKVIFKNSSPSYATVIAYNGGTYRTIGSSSEFGGYADNEATGSTKKELMQRYLDFFSKTSSALNADFSANKTEILEHQAIIFSDKSSGNIKSRTWIFEGGTPATSTELQPEVTYNNYGEYSVTLIVRSDNDSSVIVKPKYIKVNGIAVSEINSNISAYPNPANSKLIVNSTDFEGEVNVKIYSTTGKLIADELKNVSNNTLEVDVNRFENGIYFIAFSSNNKKAVTKFVVQK